MGLIVDVRTLLSSYELMEIFGLRTIATTTSIIQRSDTFPAHLLRVGANRSPLYWWPAVASWAADTDRVQLNMDLAPMTPDPPQLYDIDQLVATHDIATRLGYAHATSFATVRDKALLRGGDHRFPDPVHRYGRNHRYSLWWWPEVLSWAYTTGRVSPSIPPRPSPSV